MERAYSQKLGMFCYIYMDYMHCKIRSLAPLVFLHVLSVIMHLSHPNM